MTNRDFQNIYRKLYMPLCMYALRIVEDTDAANDVVQTTFMRVWGLVREAHDISSPETYLYRSVRNAALGMLKEQGRFSALADDREEVSEEEMDTAERDGRLWQAIDAMPPRRREIFLMSKRDGMTYAAIADELALSVKTVENQISKALATLRADSRNLTLVLSLF